jgi:hypothetical protein
VLLGCFAGDWEMHRRYEREEKKETIPIHQLLVFAVTARGSTRRQCPRKFQTASLQLLLCLGNVFCNFGIVKVLFG